MQADDIDAAGETETPAVEPAAAPPQAACKPRAADVPIASETGSAGIMYNIAEHPESIRAVAGRLLNEAIDRQKKAQQDASACGDCDADDKPRVVYRVRPIHLLPDAEQQTICRKLDARTRVRPFEFPARHFESISALNDWVMAFSQGRGEEGKELYRRCEANCSPNYQFTIEPDGAGLQVETRVHCGLARDRDSDDYEVSTALRLECGAQARPVAEAAAQ